MPKKLPRNSKFFMFLVGSIVIFLMLRIPVIERRASGIEQVSNNFVRALDSFFAPLASPNKWFQSQNSLRTKILEDELVIRQKDADLLKLQMVQKENESLRSSFASVSATAKTWLPAHLLFSDPDFSVDLGASAGLVNGASVISSGVYIGSISWVDTNYSTVKTLSNDQIRVGVRVGKAGVLGVITRTQQAMVLTCISRTDQINVGDNISTVGDENGTESNLLVGYISSNRTRPADPVSTFLVKLALDPHNISSVIVMRREE